MGVVGIGLAVWWYAASGGGNDWIPIGGMFGALVLFSAAAARMVRTSQNGMRLLIDQLQDRAEWQDLKINRLEWNVNVLFESHRRNGIAIPEEYWGREVAGYDGRT